MVSARRITSDLHLFGRGYLRNRVGLFFGLIFPVILILIFGAIFAGGSSGPIAAYAQNNDSGQVSTQFVSALNSTSTVRVISVDTSEDFSQYLASHSASDGI